MIRSRFLARPEWEPLPRKMDAEPLEGRTPLNVGEWWKVAGKYPFVVPVRPDGSCEFRAIQKIRDQQGRPGPFKPGWSFDDDE